MTKETQRTRKRQRTRSRRRGQTPHPGNARAPHPGGSTTGTSSRNKKKNATCADAPTPEELAANAAKEKRLNDLRENWRKEKARGAERVAAEAEERNLPTLPEAGNGAPVVTSEEADREALDKLLEAAGFGTVDQLDADDYALMREAKLEALAQLCEELKMNRGQWRLHPEALARIARQMAATEKSKLEAIQLKVGKPSDRPRRGVTFRAKIGVQAAPETEKDVKAAAAAFEMEVTEE